MVAVAMAVAEEETGAEEEEALGNGEPTIRARFPSGIERNYCLLSLGNTWENLCIEPSILKAIKTPYSNKQLT